MNKKLWLLLAVGVFVIQGCIAPKIRMFTDATDPYREYTLEGTATPKVLVIQANGTIEEGPSKGLLRQDKH